MAKDAEQVNHYKLKPGMEHSYLIDGTRTLARGDLGETAPLTTAQFESFKDKFEDQPAKPQEPKVLLEDGQAPAPVAKVEPEKVEPEKVVAKS